MVGEILIPGAAGAALAGSFLSKDIINKVLGPTAEYLGNGLKDMVAKRSATIEKIFVNAYSKSDNTQEGDAVPPKVLRAVLDNGSFNDDEVSVEYFGGVLASSKTGLLRDDRAATITNCLSRLSTYQIRMHYIFYCCVRECSIEREININESKGRVSSRIFIPWKVIVSGFDFTQDEISQAGEIITHCLFGLSREDLIENNFVSGSKEALLESGAIKVEEGGGVVISPSVLGADLFLRAHGIQIKNANSLFSKDIELKPLPGISIIEGSQLSNPVSS